MTHRRLLTVASILSILLGAVVCVGSFVGAFSASWRTLSSFSGWIILMFTAALFESVLMLSAGFIGLTRHAYTGCVVLGTLTLLVALLLAAVAFFAAPRTSWVFLVVLSQAVLYLAGVRQAYA